MNALDRKKAYQAYVEYISENPYVTSQEALDLLYDATNVTEEDIYSWADSIKDADASGNSTIDIQSARFMLLMDDLRDFRDISQIRSSRSDILKSAYNSEELAHNTDYIYLA